MPAALLDLDGTLVDTNYHHALAWWRAFRRHSITLPRRAGVETICVITGGFSRQELEEAGAAAVFESVDELQRNLDGTPLSSS